MSIGFKTYKLPFKTGQGKALYWSLYDDLRGGFFCTLGEVLPLGSALVGAGVTFLEVENYLTYHKINLEGNTNDSCVSVDAEILNEKPFQITIDIPKIVW